MTICNYAAQRKAIAEHIQALGDRPEHMTGTRLLSTVDMLGGGDWFEISADGIWYCKNNGGDGDDWSANNVHTWRAGAIGHRIDFDQAIADQLRSLSENPLSGQALATAEERGMDAMAADL